MKRQGCLRVGWGHSCALWGVPAQIGVLMTTGKEEYDMDGTDDV
jgi:hypothetical protein